MNKYFVFLMILCIMLISSATFAQSSCSSGGLSVFTIDNESASEADLFVGDFIAIYTLASNGEFPDCNTVVYATSTITLPDSSVLFFESGPITLIPGQAHIFPPVDYLLTVNDVGVRQIFADITTENEFGDGSSGLQITTIVLEPQNAGLPAGDKNGNGAIGIDDLLYVIDWYEFYGVEGLIDVILGWHS